MPTSTDTAGHPSWNESGTRFEARVAADGRIESLTEVSTDGRPRPVLPFSDVGIAILTHGRNIEYRFDEERRLRDLPYLDVLAALCQEVLLTAHKVRHGELLDEPELLPALRGLLRRIESAADDFRRASQASAANNGETSARNSGSPA